MTVLLSTDAPPSPKKKQCAYRLRLSWTSLVLSSMVAAIVPFLVGSRHGLHRLTAKQHTLPYIATTAYHFNNTSTWTTSTRVLVRTLLGRLLSHGRSSNDHNAFITTATESGADPSSFFLPSMIVPRRHYIMVTPEGEEFPLAFRPTKQDEAAAMPPSALYIPYYAVQESIHIFGASVVSGKKEVYKDCVHYWDQQHAGTDLGSGGYRPSNKIKNVTTPTTYDNEQFAIKREEHYYPKVATSLGPAGRHLLFDIHYLDPVFLKDKNRLEQATMQAIGQSKLSILSFYCHDQQATKGVSCTSVLVESLISVHTHPSTGVLYVDLFTWRQQNLLTWIPIIRNVFAGQGSSSEREPVMNWSLKNRGYNDYYDAFGNMISPSQHPARSKAGDSSDVDRYLLGWTGNEVDEKTPVVVAETNFQRIEIYGEEPFPIDKKEESPSTTTKTKRVFLDGVLQSTLQGLEAYHEALVHPALFVAGEPRRVAVIGGGEGATLREVLKHESVETCVMVEIDDQFVELVSEYLPEWNDCGDLDEEEDDNDEDYENEDLHYGREYVSCFDNPRAEIHFENAVTWFIDRYANKEAIKEEDKFDVIIMDALDPSSSVEFSDILYSDEVFVTSLANALTDQGVMVVQIGEGPSFSDLEDIDSIPETADPNIHKTKNPTGVLISRFEAILKLGGIVGIKSYSESHGEFLGPWEFRLAFKSHATITKFFSEPAAIDLAIAQRAIDTKSGQHIFRYFDGPTMASIQFPSGIDEEYFCDYQAVRPLSCQFMTGLDPHANALESHLSTQGFSFVDAFDHSSCNIDIPASLTDLVVTQLMKSKAVKIFQRFAAYVFDHGRKGNFDDLRSIRFGITGAAANPCHNGLGCINQTNISAINREETVGETLSPDFMTPHEILRLDEDIAVYDPVLDRRRLILETVQGIWERETTKV
ncbi:hypothetical protein ACA910_015384 [Epithemia clementina (nom. ined.)]